MSDDLKSRVFEGLPAPKPVNSKFWAGYTKCYDFACASLASAQRGKEAAERELQESEARYENMCKTADVWLNLCGEHVRERDQLQQERDRLAARLDAADALIPQWRASASTALSGRALNMCANELEIAISSSPSTSAVAEEEK